MAWSKAKTALAAGVVILAAAGITVFASKHSRRSAMLPPPDIIKQLEMKPGNTLTVDAVHFLSHLKSDGQLPGFPTNENTKAFIMIQNLCQGSDGTWKFSRKDADSFPATRTIHASKNNDGNFFYYYTVVRDSETANWRLTKAWRTDGSRKTVEEFSIP